MEKKSTRIDYIDTAKAYLILLVVLGHILIVLNPGYDKIIFTLLQSFIYTFHMPAFFLIHGILFNGEKWKVIPAKEYVFKRIYSLIVPYLFFELLGIIWKAIFSNQPLINGLYNLITIRCNVGADWFLPAMFMGSMLFIIYVKHPQTVVGIISIVVCFILSMFMSEQQYLIVVGRALLAYGFIMIGYLGKSFFQSEKVRKFRYLIVSFLITVGVAVISLKWCGNDFYSCTVDNPVTFVIGGISGTVLILGVSRILHYKLFASIGKYTLIIMGTHQLVIYAFSALIPGLYGGSWGEGVCLLLIIAVFEIPVIYILDRFLPFFVGKKKCQNVFGFGSRRG